MDASPLKPLWNLYASGTPVRELERHCGHAESWFYLAVLSYSEGDDAAAAHYADLAYRVAPASLLYAAAVRHLTRTDAHGRHRVYTDPEGFAAFVRGGGNVALYEALSRRLCDRYAESSRVQLLDIGVGDGLALLPALSSRIAHTDLLEPSAELLQLTSQALAAEGIAHQSWNIPAQRLGSPEAPWPAEPWTIAQATFSLHNIPCAQRHDFLQQLRSHTRRLLLAEFDVPPHVDGIEPEAVARVCARYEHGLAEYADDGGVVSQGFLMPVMFGYFDPNVTHEEQPVASWTQELEAAGFSVARPATLLYDYWWAPAYLMDVSVAS